MDRLVLQRYFAALPLGAFVMSHIFLMVSCVYSVVSETGWDACGRSDVIALMFEVTLCSKIHSNPLIFSHKFLKHFTHGQIGFSGQITGKVSKVSK